jgi:hypothetical protein
VNRAPLSDPERRILLALRDESPWRFGNGVVVPSVVERFGDPYPHLDRLEERGLVHHEFYATGAVHEYEITGPGRAAVGDSHGTGPIRRSGPDPPPN